MNHIFQPGTNPRFCSICDHHESNPVHSFDPLDVAVCETRPHSLIKSQRTFQCLAVVPGVAAAWGYAYENGKFDR